MILFHRHKIWYVRANIPQAEGQDATVKKLLGRLYDDIRPAHLKLIFECKLITRTYDDTKRLVRIVLNVETEVVGRVQASHNSSNIVWILVVVRKVTKDGNYFSNWKLIVSVSRKVVRGCNVLSTARHVC